MSSLYTLIFFDQFLLHSSIQYIIKSLKMAFFEQQTQKKQVQNPYSPVIDFKNLFTNPEFDVQALLALNQICKEVQIQYRSFSKLLKNRIDIAKALFDWALRPQCMIQQSKSQLKNNYPHLSFKIICNMLQSPIYFSNQSSQFSNKEFNYDHPLLPYIFLFLQQKFKFNETAAGYLNHIIKLIIQQHSFELFTFILKKSSVLTFLFQHLDSTNIMEIINQFFRNQQPQSIILKQDLLNRLFGEIQFPKESTLVDSLHTLTFIVINTKIQYLKVKNNINFFLNQINLLNLIMTENNLDIIFTIITQNLKNQNVLIQCFEFLLSLSDFEKEIDKSFQNVQLYEIRNPARKRLLRGLIDMLYILYKQQNQDAFKIKQYKFLMLCLIECIIKTNTSIINEIISHQFVKLNVDWMKKYKFNNFLHNCQRNILLIALKTDAYITVCSKSSQLISFIMIQLSDSNQKSDRVGYISHLLQLAKKIQELRKSKVDLNTFMLQYQEWNKFILNSYQKKKSKFQNLLAQFEGYNEIKSFVPEGPSKQNKKASDKLKQNKQFLEQYQNFQQKQVTQTKNQSKFFIANIEELTSQDQQSPRDRSDRNSKGSSSDLDSPSSKDFELSFPDLKNKGHVSTPIHKTNMSQIDQTKNFTQQTQKQEDESEQEISTRNRRSEN